MSHAQYVSVDPLADTMRFDILSDTQPIRLPTFDPSAVQWFEAGEASAAAEWEDEARRRAHRWCVLARVTVAAAGCTAAVLWLVGAH